MIWFVLFNLWVAKASEQSLTELSNRLAQILSRHSLVEGAFSQDRRLEDLKINIKSEGNFQFKPSVKLLWHQKKPFLLTLEMDSDKITQINPDQTRQTITRNDQPMLFAFSQSFIGVFAGKRDAIEKLFTYKIKFKQKRWTLELIPKEKLFREAIRQVVIRGEEYVDFVEVIEASGNRTRIDFRKVRGV